MTRMERQVYVIMPAFQPEAGLAERIRELVQEIRARILVIDDGSGPEYEEIFAEAETIEGCLVLRHESNQGKGRALKTGFSFVRSRLSGAEEERAGRRTLILCVDCDGQHFAPDGLRLLKKAAGYPGSLVLECGRFPKIMCRSGPGQGTGQRPGSFRKGRGSGSMIPRPVSGPLTAACWN